MVCLLAERSNTKSNVKLGAFRSQLQASNVSTYIEELGYNETVCLWMTIYLIFMYKKDLALNNLLIVDMPPNQTKPYIFNIYV